MYIHGFLVSLPCLSSEMKKELEKKNVYNLQ
jgi:hypothetical protein